MKKRNRNEEAIAKCSSKIRAARIAAGLTQEQVSSALEMDNSQYGRIERGEINITISTLYDIAQVLNISPERII